MKKVLSLVLAVMMVFGLTSVAFAANYQSHEWNLGISDYNSGIRALDFGKTYPGYENTQIKIFVQGRRATRSEVRVDKIDVKTKLSEGSKAIDSVAVKYEGSNDLAYVKIKFIDPFVSTKELDYNFDVYLTYNKSRITIANATTGTNNAGRDDTYITVSGTLENYKQEVDENDDHVYLYDWPLVEAIDYVKAIEVDLGQGLSIHTKMFEDKKYYGYVNQEIKAEDDDVVTKYPSIDTIYYLQTINLNSSGNYVTMDLDSKYYIYNADLQYIGTSNDKLPYSTKYYVSSVELDVDDANLDDIPSGGDSENVPGGGDDVPTNVNNNPGTGC